MRDKQVLTDFERSCVRWRSDTNKKGTLTLSHPHPVTLNNFHHYSKLVRLENVVNRIFTVE